MTPADAGETDEAGDVDNADGGGTTDRPRLRRSLLISAAALVVAYIVAVVITSRMPAQFPTQGDPSETRACYERFDGSADGQAALDRMERAVGEEVSVFAIGRGGTCYFAIAPAASEHAHALVSDGDRIRPTGAGCGEGRGRHLVPDFGFGEACDSHDVCYAFGADGERVSRAECDRRLRIDATRTCRDRVLPIRAGCTALAWSYWAGVRVIGGLYFID